MNICRTNLIYWKMINCFTLDNSICVAAALLNHNLGKENTNYQIANPNVLFKTLITLDWMGFDPKIKRKKYTIQVFTTLFFWLTVHLMLSFIWYLYALYFTYSQDCSKKRCFKERVCHIMSFMNYCSQLCIHLYYC